METYFYNFWNGAVVVLLTIPLVFFHARRARATLDRIVLSVAPYFFSFGPVVMLVYLLYIVSGLQ